MSMDSRVGEDRFVGKRGKEEIPKFLNVKTKMCIIILTREERRY